MLKPHKVKLVCKRTIVPLTLLVLLLSGMMVSTHIPAPISIQKVEAQSGCSLEGFIALGRTITTDGSPIASQGIASAGMRFRVASR